MAMWSRRRLGAHSHGGAVALIGSNIPDFVMLLVRSGVTGNVFPQAL